MYFLYNIFKFCILLKLVLFVVCVHRTLEEAREARQNLVKKYLKKLKKVEGAIQLVGGKNEYEGKLYYL